MSLTRREFTTATGAAGLGLFGAAALGSGLSAPAHAERPGSDSPAVAQLLDQDPDIHYLGHPVNSQIGARCPKIGLEDGQWRMYQVFKGEPNTDQPGTFVVTDIDTGEVMRAIKIPAAEAVADLSVATDGRVYLRTYYDFHVYRYDPVTKELDDLGPINPDAERDDAFGTGFGPDGRVFLGTYPKSIVCSIDPVTGEIENLGTVNPEEDYIHFLAWDPGTDALFVATGGVCASIWRIDDVGRGTKTKIIDENNVPRLGNVSFVGGLDVIEGHVVVRDADRLIVTDLDGNLEYFPDIREISGYHVVPLLDRSGFLFSSHGAIRKYDFASATHTAVAGEVRSYFAQAVEVEPGLLKGVDAGGPFVLNYLTGERTEHEVSYQQPTKIQRVFPGPENTMYASGYMKGFAQINKEGREPHHTVNVGQYESWIVRDELMYLSSYGSSVLSSYDPATPEVDPVRLYSSVSHGFDRPFATAYNPDLDELYMGSVAGYGKYQGGISIYPFDTKEPVFLGVEIAEDQGVVSMAYNPDDKLLYIGTTIDGGMGLDPTSATLEGQIVIVDPASREVVDRFVPVRNREGVTGMTFTPDGALWAVAEEQLMRLDPEAREVTTYGAVTRAYSPPPTYTWSWAELTWSHRDGMLYGTANGNLFRIDPATRTWGDWTMIAEGGASRGGIDETGDIYFANRTELFVYRVPFSPRGEPTDATKLAAVLDLEAGRSIRFPADYPQRWRRVYEVIERQVTDGQAERLKQIYSS